MFLNQSAVNEVVKVTLSLLDAALSRIRRVMKIAVNSEERIPIINVVAKPLIGPSPK